MSAYAILDIEVFDKEKFKEYQNIAPEIVKKYGGKNSSPRRRINHSGR